MLNASAIMATQDLGYTGVTIPSARGPVMQLETCSYTKDSGWSVERLPALDSERTLVLAFGSPEFLDDPRPIHQLHRVYPNSHLVGCSTAGEIFGTNVA